MGVWRGRIDGFGLRLLIAESVLIAGAMGLLARRGFWFADDLDLLVDGGKGFSPSALLAPANDHVVPGLRFVFAAFAHLGFNYDVTVVWRAVVQALALVLMGLLVHRLTGSTTWSLVATALYGLSPLGIPPYMQLSAAVNDVHAQLFALAFLHATLDWFVHRRRLALLLGLLALLLCLSFWLKAGLIVTTAAALAWIMWRVTESRSWRRDVLPWVLTCLAPIALFGALVLANRRPGATVWPGLAVMLRLLAESTAYCLVQPFAGGPWTWTPTPPYAFAQPGPTAVVLGSVVLATLVALAAWRARPVLLLWASVVVFGLVTVIAVAPGRYHLFGDILVRTYHYWSDMSIPAVLATVMTLDPIVRRAQVGTWRRPVRRLAIASMALWLGSAAVSHVTFAREWGQNPARAFFATIQAELTRTGSPQNLWDTTLPPTVAPAINDHSRVSDVFAMAGYPFRIQQPDSAPLMVTEDGHLRPGVFQQWGSGVVPPDCAMRLLGASSVTIPLSTHLPPANWYVSMAYLANPDADVSVYLEDSTSGDRRRLTDHHQPWPSGLLTAYLNDGDVHHPLAADRILVTSTNEATNLCIGTTSVGLIGTGY